MQNLAASAFIALAEYLPRDEDPETGMFATVTCSRTNASQVLGIAAISAFAECGAGSVIDDSGLLASTRLISPRQLVERLKPDGPMGAIEAAIDAVLRKTALRRDY